MSIAQIAAQIELHEAFLAMFEGQEEHAELVAALVAENGKLRRLTEMLGALVI